jgi:hypothetical protein
MVARTLYCGAASTPSRCPQHPRVLAAARLRARRLALAGARREAPLARVALADCRLPGVDVAARCGMLEVWEDRAAKSGRRIALQSRWSRRARAPRSPIRSGDRRRPGAGRDVARAQVMPLFARLNDSRDVVFLDQRGTGKSHPLNCEDSSQPMQTLFEDALPERLW